MSDKTISLDTLDSNASPYLSIETQMAALFEWLSERETREKLQACAHAVIEAFQQDMTLRVPRDEKLRKNGFSQWLQTWRERLTPTMNAEFARQFPTLVIHEELRVPFVEWHDTRISYPQTGSLPELVSLQIWQLLIEPVLLQYAIRGLATAWMVRNLGDAVVLESPEWNGTQWIVNLRLRGHSQTIGVVVLDRDGNVKTESSSSRQYVLAQING